MKKMIKTEKINRLLFTVGLMLLSIFQLKAQTCPVTIQNPGFDTNLAGWNSSGSTERTISSTYTINNSPSVNLFLTSALTQNVSVCEGTTTVLFYFKVIRQSWPEPASGYESQFYVKLGSRTLLTVRSDYRSFTSGYVTPTAGSGVTLNQTSMTFNTVYTVALTYNNTSGGTQLLSFSSTDADTNFRYSPDYILDNITIIQPQPTTPTPLSTSLVSCTPTADLTTVQPSPASGTTIEWFTAGNVLVANPTSVGAGTYYMKAKNCNDCSSDASANVTVQIISPPTVSSTAISNVCPVTTVDIASLITSPTPSGYQLKWFTDAALTVEYTGNAAAVATSGTYYAVYTGVCTTSGTAVAVTITTCCLAGDTPPSLASANNVAATCDNGDLTTLISTTGQPAGTTITYHTGYPATDANKINNPTTASTGIYYAAFWDSANGCYSPVSAPIYIAKCLTNSCPLTTADLTTVTTSTPPAGSVLEWHTSYELVRTNVVPDPTKVGDGIYWAVFYDEPNDCYSPISIPVKVTLRPVPEITGSSTACVGDELQLNTTSTPPATGNPWSSSNSVIAPVDNTGKVRILGRGTTGTVTITFTNTDGCQGEKEITIYAVPVQPKLTTTPENNCGIKGSITVTPQAGVEYSIDGTNYQTSNTFTNLDAGIYTVYLKNGNGCVSTANAVVQIDSDCDGIGDIDDLDDDNDGILDTEENNCGSNLVVNPSFEAQNFLDGSVGNVWAPYGTYFGQDLNNDQLTGWAYTTNLDGWSSIAPDMAAAADGNQYVDVLGKNSRSANRGEANVLSQVVPTEIGKTYIFSFYWGEDMGNTEEPFLGETNLTASVLDNTTQVVLKTENLREMAEGAGSGIRGPKHWNFYLTTFVASSVETKIQFTAVASGWDFGTGAAIDMVTVQELCDDDNDGIPNQLDPDSDGDGCPDAIEGSERVLWKHVYPLDHPTYPGQIKVKADGITTGLPNEIISSTTSALGVPELVNPQSANSSGNVGVVDGTDGTTDIGQGIGDSQDNTKNVACKNLWYGNSSAINPTTWSVASNWTQDKVPTSLATDNDASVEDVEFATMDNNGTMISGVPRTGAAVANLHVDANRKIKNLINSSDVNLVVPPNSSLTILEKVNGTKRTDVAGIQVQTLADNPTGTFIVKNQPAIEPVSATVQFYNKAYDCKDCGFYTRSWQYFGIPVNSSLFPSTGVETINQWSEATNGNKWVTPTNPLTAFTGYEITNSATSEPTQIYEFTGQLNLGNAAVALTKTSGVNYSGINLVGNSYTAAIPINEQALQFTSALSNKTVYLFNTGTRDEWRKLNGSSVHHNTQGGQYKAVPIKLAGSGGLPGIIPSMHTFMLQINATNTLTLRYDQLVNNTMVDGMAWRSATREAQSKTHNPYIIMDIIGVQSADRVWLFENPMTTRGFDNGWDGRKIIENGIAQLYVSGMPDEKFQVATVPSIENTELGFVAKTDDNYIVNFLVSSDVEGRALYLLDKKTNQYYPILNGVDYNVPGLTNSVGDRFRIVAENSGEVFKSSVEILTKNNAILLINHSDEQCVASVYDVSGKIVLQHELLPHATELIPKSNQLLFGVYLVKVRGERNVNAFGRVMIK